MEIDGLKVYAVVSLKEMLGKWYGRGIKMFSTIC